MAVAHEGAAMKRYHAVLNERLAGFCFSLSATGMVCNHLSLKVLCSDRERAKHP